MMKSCNVIKYFKISKSTSTHILWKYNSCLLKNAQTFPLRGKKKSVKLLQGIRNCCPLIEGAWQRDISMNNAGTIIKTPKNSYNYFSTTIFLVIIMLNKARGLLVGLWWHQQGLSGYAWQHHLKDDQRHPNPARWTAIKCIAILPSVGTRISLSLFKRPKLSQRISLPAQKYISVCFSFCICKCICKRQGGGSGK